VAVGLDPDLCDLYGVAPLAYPIHAVALNHACADVHAPLAPGWIQREYERMWFGRHPRRSPLYRHSSLTETARPETFPPILVMTSAADEWYPLAHSLIHDLEERGFRFETAIPAPTGADAGRLGHVFNVHYPDWPESVALNDRLADFVERHVPSRPALWPLWPVLGTAGV
jgi:hypothetical protein